MPNQAPPDPEQKTLAMAAQFLTRSYLRISQELRLPPQR
jgi:hypothetical protein